MKHTLLLSLFLLLNTWHAMAQHDVVQPTGNMVVDSCIVSAPTDSLHTPTHLLSYRRPFLMSAPGLDGCHPCYYGAYGPTWQLHEGFNAQLSMSMMAGLGKGAPKGVGFGQSATFAYVMPLGKRFSWAAGVYAQNFDWGAWHRTDAGIAAAFGYHINEWMSLYAYATKSFLPKDAPQTGWGIPFYDWALRDRIGAMAEFKIGKHAAIQVSVERSSAPAYPAMPYMPTHPNNNDFMTRP